MSMRALLVLTAALAGTAAPALAGGIEVLVTDRQAHAIWWLHDNVVVDGHIDETTERTLFFGAGNTAGITIGNVNALAYRPSDGLILFGDITTKAVYWCKDLNGDGTAMGDANAVPPLIEAGVWCNGNVPGSPGPSAYFSVPSGIAFNSAGSALITNAGAGVNFDGLWLTSDNGDRDALDAGEIVPFTTLNGFCTSNGGFSPQEVVYDHADVAFLHNSSGGLHGIWRMHDDGHNGAVDTAAEFSLWFGVGNGSGLPLTAGTSLQVDPTRARTLYFQCLTTIPSNGTDQVLRISDFNNLNGAMDAGEATVVFQTSEGGFASIDVCPLGDGSILLSDNSGKRIIHLTDNNNDSDTHAPDGDFMDAGERTDYLSAGGGLGEVRTVLLIKDQGCSPADIGKQGGIMGGDNLLDNNDFVVFITLFFAQAPNADIGKQGGIPGYDGLFDNNDFIIFINRFFAGCIG